jgi:hypothetical protein
MRVALDTVWRVQCINEQSVRRRRRKNVYGQDWGWLGGCAPPEPGTAGNTHCADDGRLDRVETTQPSAVFGVTLESTLEPYGLTVGA